MASLSHNELTHCGWAMPYEVILLGHRLVQVMACHLCGTKSIPEVMMLWTYNDIARSPQIICASLGCRHITDYTHGHDDMMSWCHGNVFCFTVPMWGESTCMIIIPPLHRRWKGGILDSPWCLSVRLSVRPSVRPSVGKVSATFRENYWLNSFHPWDLYLWGKSLDPYRFSCSCPHFWPSGGQKLTENRGFCNFSRKL